VSRIRWPRTGRDDLAVRVAAERQDAAGETHQAVQRLARPGTGGQVARQDDRIRPFPGDVREDGIEGGEVAVEIGEDGDAPERCLRNGTHAIASFPRPVDATRL
jgi:hypothetical protein